MPTKSIRPHASQPTAASKGTVIAAKCRAEMNSFTDERCQELRYKALSRIYATPYAATPVHAGRR